MSDPARAEREIRRLKAHIDALEAERDRLRQRDWNYQAIYDRVCDQLTSERPHPRTHPPATPNRFPGLSFVVVYYDIPRQIERTLTSLSPAYQGMDPNEIEVILVDNGSPTPLPEDLQQRHPHIRQILRVEGHPSPVEALNRGAAAASFDMIALMIDGAHLLSPGVARHSRDIWGLFDNPVINVPQYMLGRESQNLTPDGKGAFEREAEILAEAGWPRDGYRIFDDAVYPGENFHRNYSEAIETNCLITTRAVLDRCGGFDPRYDEPGGGFANLEIFSRLIHDPLNSYLVLPGEGSFHQDHRGTTTQHGPEERTALVTAYRKRHQDITGSEAILNARSPFYFGKVRRLTQRIPTISRDFAKASNRIQRQLADVFVARVRAGMRDDYKPDLAVGPLPDERLARPPLAPTGQLPEAAIRNGAAEKDLSYLLCLRRVHEAVAPKLYFEIGIDTGASLALAKCPSIGVDPAYMISSPIRQATRIFKQTSDDFFADTERAGRLFKDGIDLAFIDGMHLAEFVLRDFIETEKHMRPGGVVLFDDVLPDRIEMAERKRRFSAWCGDVYKIVPILRRWRPDLTVSVFESFVGPYRKGLAVVSGLDPENRVLEQNYAQIEAEILAEQVDHADNIVALDALMRPLPISALPAAARGEAPRDLHAALTRAAPAETAQGNALPEAPRLSVVITAHDMARELPRTLETLAPGAQRGIAASDYELIIVDNGSTTQPDWAACTAIAPNARIVALPPGQPSPCHALNTGMALARGAVIGALIDGARMVSPGLLAAALEALEDRPLGVVGSFGLHLGDQIQVEAAQAGYDQAAEDALLDSIDWRGDGYRLFDISVLSKSSGKGWDVLPSESNTVFAHRGLWLALNGFDEGFVTPGGGLTNLDLWKRACEYPGAEVAMLRNEASFHQFHGGVTTGQDGSTRRAGFDAEYRSLRGQDWQRPNVETRFIGAVPGQSRPGATS